jgi:TolA-binding protein
MKSLFAALIVAMLCAGCSTAPAPQPAREPPKSLLDEADTKLSVEDYKGASALYGEFVKAQPGNAQAARARATQTVLSRLLDSQTELERVKRNEELPRIRRDLSERQSEVERLKAENAKLRADLERLRSIDLQTLPGIKK